MEVAQDHPGSLPSGRNEGGLIRNASMEPYAAWDTVPLDFSLPWFPGDGSIHHAGRLMPTMISRLINDLFDCCYKWQCVVRHKW